MTAECHVHLAEEISIAAGMGRRDEGERDQVLPCVQTAHGQERARAADERISCDAPMKNDVKPHRKCASLHSWQGHCREFGTTRLDLILSLACKQSWIDRRMST